jgi:hypothetical protein
MIRFVGQLVMSLILVGAVDNAMAADRRCREVSVSEWEDLSRKWNGLELVAFASWCSSCKDNLASVRTNPEKFVLLAVFDDAPASERVLQRLGITSPCLRGEKLADLLGVASLPWRQMIRRPDGASR